MISWIRKALARIRQLIWPQGVVCLLCDELADDGFLCSQCCQGLKRRRICDQTGTVRSAYTHRGEARQLVLELKFSSMADAAETLSAAMAEEARMMQLPKDTLITWVPMGKRRKTARGIDHGQKLAEALAERLGLQARPVMERTRRVHTQLGLNGVQRRKNLKGVFRCTETLAQPVLLVDDVLTTGSTLAECTEQLTQSGATAVFGLTATRAGSSR